MSLSVSTTSLCPQFSVCGQISVADVEKLARMGFRSIVNNRPDREGGPDQPLSADIQQAAEQAGLRYVYFAIPNLMLSQDQVSQYQRLCANLPHPILAFCGSGKRASALFHACDGKVGGQ